MNKKILTNYTIQPKTELKRAFFHCFNVFDITAFARLLSVNLIYGHVAAVALTHKGNMHIIQRHSGGLRHTLWSINKLHHTSANMPQTKRFFCRRGIVAQMLTHPAVLVSTWHSGTPALTHPAVLVSAW